MQFANHWSKAPDIVTFAKYIANQTEVDTGLDIYPPGWGLCPTQAEHLCTHGPLSVGGSYLPH